MHTSQPARGKLVLRSSHRSFRLGVSHAAPATDWRAPAKDAKPAAPARPAKR